MKGLGVILAVVATAVIYAAFDRESGIPSWLRLREQLDASEWRIGELRREIDALRAEATALRDDSFAIERAIREDLDLARPGETVVRFHPAQDSNPRFP